MIAEKNSRNNTRKKESSCELPDQSQLRATMIVIHLRVALCILSVMYNSRQAEKNCHVFVRWQPRIVTFILQTSIIGSERGKKDLICTQKEYT